MKLTAYKHELETALNAVAGARGSNSDMIITKGIYMKDNIVLATDLELGIKTNFKADIINSGAVVFPGGQILNIVKELPNEQVKITVNDNLTAKIECGNSKFEINCYNADEYPQLPRVKEPKTLEVDSSKLVEAFNKVKVAASTDETTPNLCGVYLSEGDFVATNKYRMATMETNIKTDSMILPAKSASEVVKLGADKIEYSDNYIKFIAGDTVLISRLIEGQFPNYNQVIPDDAKTYITTHVKTLNDAVRRVYIVAKEDTGVIRLTTNKTRLEIASVGGEGEAHETIESEIEGKDRTINVQANYLMDLLKTIDGEYVRIGLNSNIKPLIVGEEDYTHLIMPMRND
ncbi:MAG: DNA polymerase III subunit beta [Halanaerobiales bacterium]|nr:DNA polymerase III subunit beta [Halanaerobiales bacterium]